MIVGLCQPDEGAISIREEVITDLPMYRRARKGIGYLPQESSVFRRLSVEDNVLAILEMLDYSRAERRDRVDVLLSRDAGEKGTVTGTVLRNLRVLAIDQAVEPAKDAKTIVGAVATLEVASGDAELMADAQAQAKKGGALVLALRAYTDAGAPAGGGGSGSGGSGRMVRVYRAGQASEVTVSR